MSLVLHGTDGVTFNDSSLQVAAASPYVLKNRIINGDMVIDQRNAGASVTPTSTSAAVYTVDRWAFRGTQASKVSIQQNAGAVTPPIGFSNYLGITSLSAYSVLSSDSFVMRQFIEGFNVADLNWGTANAASVTLSFWARSSLTGTFGGALANSASNRSYPFTYTISSANTWEQKNITIAGDTTGTWLTTNGTGIRIDFGLGVGTTNSGTAGAWAGVSYQSATGATSVIGTNGATFYITGVQLEVGTSATPFERRLYNQELANCQRYYLNIFPQTGSTPFGVGHCTSTTGARGTIAFPVAMRIAPSALEQSGTAGDYAVLSGGGAITCSAVPTYGQSSNFAGQVTFVVASGLTTGQGIQLRTLSSDSYLAWSAEL